jgi:hypothetical protein
VRENESVEEQEQTREVVWMPAFAAAAVTLILTSILLPVGSLLTLASLVVLVVRLARRQWSVLTWLCLGSLVGAAVFWILVAAHATF